MLTRKAELKREGRTVAEFDHQIRAIAEIPDGIDGLSIVPETSLDDIVRFKKHHKDELGRFRTQLASLIQTPDNEKPISIIQKEIKGLYNNEVMPAYNDLTKALKGPRIKRFTETLLKVSTISAGATNIMALLGAPSERAVCAVTGLSIIVSAVSHDTTKKEALRQNPYA